MLEQRCSCGSRLPRFDQHYCDGSYVCNRCFANDVRQWTRSHEAQRLADEQQTGVQMLFAAGVGVMVSLIVIVSCVGAWM